MNKLKKIGLLVIVTVGVILSISGCKKKTAMSDADIVKTVQLYITNNFPEYSFDGCDVWINDRTTYLEDGYDYADVYVNAYCDEIAFYLDYSASFYYDENAWYLYDMMVTDGEHQVLTSYCSEELARGYIDGEYYGVEFVDRDLDLSNGKDTFIFKGRKTDYWGSELTHTIEVKFYYSLYNGWKYSKTDYKGEGILNLDPGSGYIVVPEIPEIYDRGYDRPELRVGSVKNSQKKSPELIVQPVDNNDYASGVEGFYKDGTVIESDEYIFPESQNSYLTVEDLAVLTEKGICYAKNEIFARYGRTFKASELQEFFDGQQWYDGRYGGEYDSEIVSKMNQYEKYNLDIFVQAEQKYGQYSPK